MIDAAQRLFGRPVIEPAIVYANLLLPGQELAVHTDVPEFRGANRKVIPQWLLVVMHHSGLFDAWRMPIATGVAYFAPHGQEADGRRVGVLPRRSRRRAACARGTPQHGDRARHRLGVPRGGSRRRARHRAVRGRAGATCWCYDGDHRWSIRPHADSAEHLHELAWNELRFSISWKAYCFADEAERDAWRTHADDLTLDRILDELRDDLAARGVLAKDAPIADRDLALLLIDTYEHYPEPRPAA